MIGPKEAMEIASRAIGPGVLLDEPLSSEHYWFVGVSTEEDGEFYPIPGVSPIVVSKADGEVSGVPSVPYFLTGMPPTQAEIELERAVPVSVD